jgi:quinol monooxygenase YgiN
LTQLDASIRIERIDSFCHRQSAFSVYSANRAGIRSLARIWSIDLKECRIRVNAISPGIIPTPGYNTSLGMSQEQIDQFVQNSFGNIPLALPGTAGEIAKAILFLASDDASDVTGIELFVNDGSGQMTGVTRTEDRMQSADKITLVVHFRVEQSAKQEFIAKLQDVFAQIVNEETFVEASLVQDMRDPQSILNYEVWNESPESFTKNQMSKAYRAEFEKMIVDLRIERTPVWYSTIAEWMRN